MRAYLQSTWTKVGLGLLLVGSGPSSLHHRRGRRRPLAGPEPQSHGPGLLFFFTFWPAVICIVIGVVRVRSRSCIGPGFAREPAGPRDPPVAIHTRQRC